MTNFTKLTAFGAMAAVMAVAAPAVAQDDLDNLLKDLESDLKAEKVESAPAPAAEAAPSAEVAPAKEEPVAESDMFSLEDVINQQVIDELKNTDINTLSPYECMTMVFNWKKRLG